MKLIPPFLFFALTAGLAFGAAPFPGLQKIMTEAEWKRAGLDRLTPDQIGVIDAAIIRAGLSSPSGSPADFPPPPPSHSSGPPSTTASLPTATPSAAVPTSPPSSPAPGANPAEATAARSRFWEKFGLGKASSAPDWRTQPPMAAKVAAWQGANRFVLDTGQVWEGVDAIPYEILGQSVTIEARPMGAFALKLNPDSVAVRVRRVK